MKEPENELPAHLITELLRKAHDGDEAARDELIERVYPVLQQMARKRLQPTDRAAQHLNPSDVLNKALLQLIQKPETQPKKSGATVTPQSLLERYEFENRTRFFGLMGRMMRNVITDEIRRAYGQKGDERVYLTLTGVDRAAPQTEVSWQDFDRALTKLAVQDERAAQVLECRLMLEMSVEETEIAMGLSRATVNRDARFGKAFLAREFGWHLSESQ